MRKANDTKIDPKKLELVQLFTACCNWAGLRTGQVYARVCTCLPDPGPDADIITRDEFDNRFIRMDKPMYDIDPALTLAVVKAFTKGLPRDERCTPEYALKFAELTDLHEDWFQELTNLFPPGEEREELAKALVASLERKCQNLLRQIEDIKHAARSDGYVVPIEAGPQEPRSGFNPNYIKEIKESPAPSGALRLQDRLYIERSADACLNREVVKWGTTITIRAPRQTGKTSVVMRGLQYAYKHGVKVVYLDLQRLDESHLETLGSPLRYLTILIARDLRVDMKAINGSWNDLLGPKDNLTYLMEDYILPTSNQPIVLALDEADRLLQTPFYKDFFAMIRVWHNTRSKKDMWRKLNIVMVISTEPYLLIPNITQSPFNVGTTLYLEDFDEEQVSDLNERHGSPVQQSELPELMGLLNGHPYLTRMALYTLVVEELTWNELAKLAVTDHGPFGDHLQLYGWRLHNAPDLREALKQVIRHGNCEDKMALSRLTRAGLVKGSGGSYIPRCDLYRIYLKDKLG